MPGRLLTIDVIGFPRVHLGAGVLHRGGFLARRGLLTAPGLQGFVAARAPHGFVAAAEFLALQGDRAKDGRHGPQTAAAGLAEAAAPPMTAAAPRAIRVFLRESRFTIDIILISYECR